MSDNEKLLMLRLALKVHAYAVDARQYATDIERARKKLNKAFGKDRVDACLIEHHGQTFTDLLHPCGLAAHQTELANVAAWLRDIGRGYAKPEGKHHEL